MAGEQGFEPWYAGIKIQCLNQLGDSPTQLTACRHWRVFYCLNAAKPNFFTTYNIAASGWVASALAFQDLHLAGTFDSTASASTSSETAQNTQAPEPVILASPWAPSQLIASATGGNKLVATCCKSFLPYPCKPL